jgi:hypothetical protein
MLCFENLTNNKSLQNHRSSHNVFKNINYNAWWMLMNILFSLDSFQIMAHVENIIY